MRSPVRLHIKAKKFAVHLSDEPMRCPFPINCLCSTCRRTLIPSRWSANRKLPSGETRIGPEKFYKGRSQEKTLLPRPEFFLLRSPLDRAGSVRTCRAMCSVVGHCYPLVWVFSTSGFHCFFATKPVSSETSKAEQWSNLATIVLLGTRGP
jgi:hypothetical protein